MPSPARSIPSRKSKKEREPNTGGILGEQERDLLDDFIGIKVQNPSTIAAPSKFG